jgi:hypothetical protein
MKEGGPHRFVCYLWERPPAVRVFTRLSENCGLGPVLPNEAVCTGAASGDDSSVCPFVVLPACTETQAQVVAAETGVGDAEITELALGEPATIVDAE